MENSVYHALPHPFWLFSVGNRKMNPFRLYIIALPIQGKHAWMLAKDRAIVGRELVRDPVAFREWLSPVIVALL